MSYATITDLEQRWRTLSDQERARAAALLGDAKIRIDAAAPPGEGLTGGEEAARRIVSCEMVRRAMSSDGLDVVQESETTGPFGWARTYANPSGDLYLTKEDRRLLGVGSARAGNMSILDGGS